VIVDGPITYDLTLGQERRISQESDAQTVVPPSVSPVVLAIRPTVLRTQPANPTEQGSSLFHFFIARLNQAAATTVLVTLPRGLWELELSQSCAFDYAAAFPLATLSGCEIQLAGSIATVALLVRFPTIGAFVDYNRLRVLLQESMTINSFVPATGAAQNLAQKITVNCIRIL